MSTSTSTLFLLREFADLSIAYAKPGQYEETPIFDFESGEFDLDEAKKMKNDIRKFLYDYYAELGRNPISEEDHKKRLRSLAMTLTRRYKHMLYEKRYRLGVAQLAVNMFLKLLWSAGLIDEPHHCPFDNKVKRKITRFAENGWLEYWNEFTTMRDYEEYVWAARTAASKEELSIAEWDMKYFN